MCVYRSKKVVWLILGVIYDIPKKELICGSTRTREQISQVHNCVIKCSMFERILAKGRLQIKT